MADFLRPASPWRPYKSAPSTSNISNPKPAGTAPDASIKCSDCGAWMNLLTMSEHACSGTAGSVDPGSKGLAALRQTNAGIQERRKLKNEMRVDVNFSNQRSVFGAMLSAKSAPGEYLLSPLTPGGGSSSPYESEDMARSASASSSGSRMPFFERYQKLVSTGDNSGPPSPFVPGTPARQGSQPQPSLTRSPGVVNKLSNMTASSSNPNTPPFTPSSSDLSGRHPHVARGPSPLPSPALSSRGRDYDDMSYISRNNNNGNHQRDLTASTQTGQSNGSSRPTTLTDDTDESAFDFLLRPTESSPPSSISGSSDGVPSRSKKIVHEERPEYGRHQERFNGDRRQQDIYGGSLKQSHSTPEKLLAYEDSPRSSAVSPLKPVAGRRNVKKSASREGLDECLEDLKLFAEEDSEDDDDWQQDRRATVRPAPQSYRNASQERGVSHSRSTPMSANRKPLHMEHCASCRKDIEEPRDAQTSGDGQTFCKPCYADRFLPKCRKCNKSIEGGSVTSSDGKVSGKYHPECFSCFTCSVRFPNGEFYVYDRKPYCQRHYHELNGSICVNRDCGEPIEGACVSLVGQDKGDGGRYHVDCFKCAHSRCGIPLLDHHFVVDRLPYCEKHAELFAEPPTPSSRDFASQQGSGKPPKTSRAKKRQTIITNTRRR